MIGTNLSFVDIGIARMYSLLWNNLVKEICLYRNWNENVEHCVMQNFSREGKLKSDYSLRGVEEIKFNWTIFSGQGFRW